MYEPSETTGGWIHEEACVGPQGPGATSHGAACLGLSCSPETEQLVRVRLRGLCQILPGPACELSSASAAAGVVP